MTPEHALQNAIRNALAGAVDAVLLGAAFAVGIAQVSGWKFWPGRSRNASTREFVR